MNKSYIREEGNFTRAKHIIKIKKYDIFGGFLSSSIAGESGNGGRFDQKYFGDSDSFIFSLVPNFRVFLTNSGTNGKNYVYFNPGTTAEVGERAGPAEHVGLGFGGSNPDVRSSFDISKWILDYGSIRIFAPAVIPLQLTKLMNLGL